MSLFRNNIFSKIDYIKSGRLAKYLGTWWKSNMASGFLPSSTLCHPPASIASVSSSSGWAGRREACLGKKATDFCRFGNSWLYHTICTQSIELQGYCGPENGECLTGSFFTLLPSSAKAESPLRQRRHSLQQPSPVFRTLLNIWTQNWKTSLPSLEVWSTLSLQVPPWKPPQTRI